ncbi:Spc98 family-domain-containing protein [Phlyctochytrium arcticum]|nr:Spc98 family-domain-containing protein [Phlyctochytrium arcticum]
MTTGAPNVGETGRKLSAASEASRQRRMRSERSNEDVRAFMGKPSKITQETHKRSSVGTDSYSVSSDSSRRNSTASKTISRSRSISNLPEDKLQNSSSFDHSAAAHSRSVSGVLDESTLVPHHTSYNTSTSSLYDGKGGSGSIGKLNASSGASFRKESRRPTIDKAEPKFDGIGYLSYEEQESHVMQDLLYILMGMDGVHIKIRQHDDSSLSSPGEFIFDPTLDRSIVELTKRLLPLALHLREVESFIQVHSKFEYGRVHHALAATMRGLLKNFFVLIVQLEQQALTATNFGLQKMWFYLHPSLVTMNALASLVAIIDESDSQGSGRLNGGALLGTIAQRMLSFGGDPVVKALYSQLLSAAAVPYNIMLRTWLRSGEIVDPYDEFLIQETRGVKKEQLADDYNDVYWAKRYTIREYQVPAFLEPYQKKVLTAGKYLNVIRECGTEVNADDMPNLKEGTFTHPPIGDAVTAIGGERFVRDIEIAFQYSNTTLLKLLFTQHDLLARLRSIKHHFLLSQSDFLVHFIDVAHEHLLHPIDEVPAEKVASLLELVLRNPAASSKHNAFYEDISADLNPTQFLKQLLKINSVGAAFFNRGFRFGNERFDHDPMDEFLGRNKTQSGIQAFQIDYKVPFPASLIINRRVLVKYQLIFRHLFQCKYIERQLGEAWRHQLKSGLNSQGSRFRRKKDLLSELTSSETAQREREDKESAFVGRMCALRIKMLKFIQQYMYHVGYEVIEPTWSTFEERMQTASTIEDVMAVHEDYQNSLLKECMLSNNEMVKVIRKLMSICTDYCIFSHSYSRFRGRYDPEDNTLSSPTASSNSHHLSRPSSTLNPLSDAYISVSGGDILNPDAAAKKIAELEATFLHHMRLLIDTLKYHATTEATLFGNFAARLDYNQYYARLPPDLSIVVKVPQE